MHLRADNLPRWTAEWWTRPGLRMYISKERESLNAKHFLGLIKYIWSTITPRRLSTDKALEWIHIYIRSTCFGTFSDNVSPCRLHQTSCKIACSSPGSSEFGAVRSFGVDELFNRKNLIRGYPNGRVKHSNTRRIHNFPAVGQLVFFHRCIYPYTQISVNPDFEVILV